jgi:glutamate/tyrosine decarboxylase-like PLP-dependent enzyme
VELEGLLHRTTEHALAYLDGLPDRAVGPPVPADVLRARLPEALQDESMSPSAVLDELVSAVEPGLVASAGPRYFGYVVGGVVPAALAADWMTAAWDQMAGSYLGSPAAAVVEELVERWLVALFGFPPGTSVGLTTGSQMATFTALLTARQVLLEREGWDVERLGLRGAPPLRVVTGEERHVTVDVALRYLGLGSEDLTLVRCDDNGAVDAEHLRAALAASSDPTIVVAQAGNVNTGAMDPIRAIAAACSDHGAWLHVDGAFGLWARLDPERAALLDGIEGADSWGTDGHKWLNVPYDSGMVFVRDADAHRRVMRKDAAYAMSATEGERDSELFVPEFSRRARAFPVYAALRSLGRTGLAELVRRDCALARNFADQVAKHPLIEVVNAVTLNQVLLRFRAARGTEEALLDTILERIHRDGTFWAGRTSWRGRAGLRVSISGWNTTPADVDRAADALLRLVPADDHTKAET